MKDLERLGRCGKYLQYFVCIGMAFLFLPSNRRREVGLKPVRNQKPKEVQKERHEVTLGYIPIIIKAGGRKIEQVRNGSRKQEATAVTTPKAPMSGKGGTPRHTESGAATCGKYIPTGNGSHGLFAISVPARPPILSLLTTGEQHWEDCHNRS